MLKQEGRKKDGMMTVCRQPGRVFRLVRKGCWKLYEYSTHTRTSSTITIHTRSDGKRVETLVKPGEDSLRDIQYVTCAGRKMLQYTPKSSASDFPKRQFGRDL